MKVVGGAKEGGVVVGNTYDKYNSRNPFVKWMMEGFHWSIDNAVGLVNPNSILEVGCGEGYWVMKWAKQGIRAHGVDFSERAIELARSNAIDVGLPEDLFSIKSIYELSEKEKSHDLVVCCEVLEHLEQPLGGLNALRRVAKDYVLLSVPREPIWRILNFLRGKYILDLGNTPGHIQHWTKASFIKTISEHFDIVREYSPLPWTMLLCRVKH